MARKRKGLELSGEQIERIRLLHRRGFDGVTLALIFKVTPQRINQLCRKDGKGNIFQLIADLLPHLPPELPLPRCSLTNEERSALREALKLLAEMKRIEREPLEEFIKPVNEGDDNTGSPVSVIM